MFFLRNRGQAAGSDAATAEDDRTDEDRMTSPDEWFDCGSQSDEDRDAVPGHEPLSWKKSKESTLEETSRRVEEERFSEIVEQILEVNGNSGTGKLGAAGSGALRAAAARWDLRDAGLGGLAARLHGGGARAFG